MGVLLVLVSTAIPYQFAYLVACIVQLATCVRAQWHAKETVSCPHTLMDYANNKQRSTAHYNFANYAHSIFILMLWVLPINILVLLVWAHNLVVHWFMPFSSHHNVLSIMPFIILVETMTTGSMVPRVSARYVSKAFLVDTPTDLTQLKTHHLHSLFQHCGLLSGIWSLLRLPITSSSQRACCLARQHLPLPQWLLVRAVLEDGGRRRDILHI